MKRYEILGFSDLVVSPTGPVVLHQELAVRDAAAIAYLARLKTMILTDGILVDELEAIRLINLALKQIQGT